MIFRDDDISYLTDFKKFITVDELFLKYKTEHVIALLANNIEKNEELLSYLKNKPHISIQLHGWDHIDYPDNHHLVREHLQKGIEAIEKYFGRKPSVFYPPWNRTDDFVNGIAKELGLEVSIQKVSTSQYVQARGEVAEDTINFHYWAEQDTQFLELALKIYTEKNIYKSLQKVRATESVAPPLFLDERTSKMMFDLLENLPAKGRLLEIGTGMGHSALFFSKIKPGWTIYTIDGFGMFGDGRIYDKLDGAAVKNVFDYLHEAKNIIHLFGNSNTIPWELEVDVIYIDGGHKYDCVKKDFLQFAPFLKTGGYIFFHDYHREDFGVKKLVDEVVGLFPGYVLLFAEKLAVLQLQKK